MGSYIGPVKIPVPQHELVAKYPRLLELVGQGSIRLGQPNRPELYEAMPPALRGVTSAELLDQDRGER